MGDSWGVLQNIDYRLRMFEVGLWRAFFSHWFEMIWAFDEGSFAVTPKLCDNLSPFVSFPASLVGHKRTKEGLKISSGVGYHLGKHENNGWTYWWGAIHCSSWSAAQLIQQYFLSIRHTIYTYIYMHLIVQIPWRSGLSQVETWYLNFTSYLQGLDGKNTWQNDLLLSLFHLVHCQNLLKSSH